MTITEKVAYLKGLAEGLAIDTDKSKEGKLIGAIIDVLEDVGFSIEDLEANAEEMAEEMDAISDDLADVEEDLYGDEDGCDCDCDDDEFFRVECPNCGELLEIDEEALDIGVIQCPSCEQKFVLDIFDDCEDGCGCGCGHDHEDVVEEVTEEPKKSTKKAPKKSESKRK